MEKWQKNLKNWQEKPFIKQLKNQEKREHRD